MLNKFVDNGTDKLVCENLRKSEQTYGPDDFEKRTIKLAGHPRYLDRIEAMLGYMAMLGSIGHSTGFKVFVDGDGSFHCECKDESNNVLSKKHSEWIKEHSKDDGDIEHFSFD